MSGKILLVDDEQEMAKALQTGLRSRGFACTSVPSAEEALDALTGEHFDLLLTDYRLGGMDGLELCARSRDTHPDTPTIVMTAFGNMDAAVAAIRAGAYDFIAKPIDLNVLVIALERALDHHNLKDEVRRLKQEANSSGTYGKMLGDSPPMKRVFDLIDRVADSEVSILVTGATGTGKELVAEALHDKSRRQNCPFLAINCAAVPENLLEDELFGHLHGAFTGSKRTRQGLFAGARGGTVFLDEIGDMPPNLQPKLLRVLQEKRFRPVGSDEEVEADVRVIAATHRDLEADADTGRFRQDLLFRLAVVQIELPPLRERGNDILVLAQHFIDRAAKTSNRGVKGLSSAAARRLLAYEWPGNVRELQNCIERAVVLARYDEITPGELPPKIENLRISSSAAPQVEILPLEVVERRYILSVLESLEGKRGKAAEVLEIDRKTLYRKLDKWGFDT